MAGVVTPLIADISVNAGLSPHFVLASIVLGYSTVILPFQIPPVVVGYHIAGVRAAKAAVYTAGIGILTCVVSYPLQLWWMQI
jgi:hypothetical protein